MKGAISYDRTRVARDGYLGVQWGNRLVVDMGIPKLAKEIAPMLKVRDASSGGVKTSSGIRATTSKLLWTITLLYADVVLQFFQRGDWRSL
jgi:hypothetical protein